MSRIVCVVAASAGLVLTAAGPARCADWLGGVAQEQFQADLERTDKEGLKDYTAHHASTAGTLEWSPNENLKLRLTMGTVTSTLEESAPAERTTWGGESGFYMLAGVSLETELAMGGGLLLDLSYSLGETEWKESVDGVPTEIEYDHDRWGFMVGYVFGEGERARPYVAVAYNTYEAELRGGTVDKEFEYDEQLALVAGVRARSGTFAGAMEATLFGELGMRLALMFGF